jgi:hypothetical protein
MSDLHSVPPDEGGALREGDDDMWDDPVLLARIQFAANITFHILFPTITIALGWILLFMKWASGPRGHWWP